MAETPKPYLHEARLLLRKEVVERRRPLTAIARDSGLDLGQLNALMHDEIGSPNLVAQLLGYFEQRTLKQKEKLAEVLARREELGTWGKKHYWYEVALWAELVTEYGMVIEHPRDWQDLTWEQRWSKRQVLEIKAKMMLLKRIPSGSGLRSKVILKDELDYFQWRKLLKSAASKNGLQLLDSSQVIQQLS